MGNPIFGNFVRDVFFDLQYGTFSIEIDDKSFRGFNIGLSRNLCWDNRIEKPPGDPHERHYKTKNSLRSKRSKGEGKGIWTFPSLPF